jgi:outer membrane lipoprotein-sorting protein
MNGLPFAGALAVALVTASCSAPLMKLPSGPGGPAADSRDALAEATNRCRALSSLVAEVAVSGSAGGRRLRGRLHLGLQAPASARLEAVAPFGQPLFILVARGNDATLLLPNDNRVLEHGRPGAVLEALTGVPLDATDLRLAMSGCTLGADPAKGQQLGNDWRMIPDGQDLVYLQRSSQPASWRLVAVIHREAGQPEWRAEYRDFENGLPRSIHFASVEKNRFNLRLGLSQVETDSQLPAEAFLVRVPASADPISLDELRRAGPLGAR